MATETYPRKTDSWLPSVKGEILPLYRTRDDAEGRPSYAQESPDIGTAFSLQTTRLGALPYLTKLTVASSLEV
jgi:hypothetical protein